MAGNFPLAGFHDLISVIISGNIAVVKPSNDDKILINFFINYLHNNFSETKNKAYINDGKLIDFDKVIATGSNNTFKYFEYYFREKISLLRKNRTSIAVLNGKETDDELSKLSDDIFIYFGLGCRNVSKIFIPVGFDLSLLIKNFVKYKDLINHHRYSNNYNYQKTIKIMNNEAFVDGGFFILSESKLYAPPISVIYFDYYQNIDDVENLIKTNSHRIQCVVSRANICNSINLGESQNPNLNQYADDIDTLNFLLTSS